VIVVEVGTYAAINSSLGKHVEALKKKCGKKRDGVMMSLSKFSQICALYVFCAFMSGCEMMSIVSTPGQDRGFSGFLSDNDLRVRLTTMFLTKAPEGANSIEFLIHKGRVLLLGVAKNQGMKNTVISLVQKTKGVQEVIDHIRVGHEAFSDYAHDATIGHKLRSAMFLDPHVFSPNYHIRVSNRVIYILGTATSPQELKRVIDHAEARGVRQVVSCVQVLPQTPAES
jgi:osmotically-inducible protein OsmY